MAPTLIQVEERRACIRWRSRDAPHRMACRIRPGHDALIVNLSEHGALVDTRRRLVPGGLVDVLIDMGGRRAVARALVLRSAIAGLLADDVTYRGALRFDRPVAVAELGRVQNG